MTTSERSTIRLRFEGADYPDGEIPLGNLAAIAERVQQLATRLARAEEGRGGRGRSPDRLADGVRLMLVATEPGSTQLVISGPSRDPQFDLGVLNEDIIERTLDSIVDGFEAVATDSDLPTSYNDLSREALAGLLKSLEKAAPEVAAEGRIGDREVRTVRLARSGVSEAIRPAPEPMPSEPSTITVEGMFYAVDLRNGSSRIEDDFGTSIKLLISRFTNEQIAPVLGQRVVVEGTPHYDHADKIRELHATTIALAEDFVGLDPSRFWRNIELDEQLRDAEPLRSIDDLAIPGLSEEEIEAFLRSIRE